MAPPASAYHGSDDLWIRILILVNDPAFEHACECVQGRLDESHRVRYNSSCRWVYQKSAQSYESCGALKRGILTLGPYRRKALGMSDSRVDLKTVGMKVLSGCVIVSWWCTITAFASVSKWGFMWNCDKTVLPRHTSYLLKKNTGRALTLSKRPSRRLSLPLP